MIRCPAATLVVFALFRLASADVLGGCDGQIPNYVVEGNEGMVLTEEAEEVLCQEDSAQAVWDGTLAKGDVKTVVEDKVVSASLFHVAVGSGTGLEFRNCVFTDELYFRGPIKGSILFDRCEFQGNVDIHDALFEGDVRINRSILHQGVHIADSTLLQPFKISGSVLAGDLQIDSSSLAGGMRVAGTRFLGNLVANGLQSPVGIFFEESRFLASLNMTGLELGGGVRFRECEWSEKALVNFAKGTIAGGLRFDACGFESNWDGKRKGGVALVRLTDVTVSSSVVLADAKSKRFPTVKISRCLIPFLKLPQWSIAKDMVLFGDNEFASARDMEDSGELLQLVRTSYEAQGRTRDAVATRNAHRLLIARIKGQPALGIRLALNYFGTGLWWFIGTICLFASVLVTFGRRWYLVGEGEELSALTYKAFDLSLRGFFGGPPEEGELATRMTPAARRCLIVERVCGLVLMFLWGLAVSEWLEG